MLTRLYIDNFRSLVNFELKLDATNCLLGPNGSGKTSVFDALRALRDFIVGDIGITEAFPKKEFTKWTKKQELKIEIDLKDTGGNFTYSLLLEHREGEEKGRIKEEKLHHEGKLLFYRKEREVEVCNDKYAVGLKFPFDWTLSALAAVYERPDNKKLTAFKKRIENLIIVQPSPMLIQAESSREERHLKPHMENFAAWYRYLSQENLGSIPEIFDTLAKILPGLKALNSASSGDKRILKADFQATPASPKNTYSFSQLSEGQKMLIAIYALLLGTKGTNATLFIDEPDNYLSIQEIQPWLRLFVDDCGPGEHWEQIVLISHHPEVIDYGWLEAPIYFNRDPDSHTQLVSLAQRTPKNEKTAPALKLSEAISMGELP